MPRKPKTALPEGYKRCGRCHLVLPALEVHFGKQPKGSYGLTSQCKPCSSEYQKIYSAKIKDARDLDPSYIDKRTSRWLKPRPEPKERRCWDCKKTKLISKFPVIGRQKNGNRAYARRCLGCKNCYNSNRLLELSKNNIAKPVKERVKHPEGFRICYVCNLQKIASTDFFPAHTRSKNGLFGRCKTCLQETQKIRTLRELIRSRTRSILRKKGFSKKSRFCEYIGCTELELIKHLEGQFKDGMTWENQGFMGWHIDHVIPLGSAKTVEEVYILCHYTNLQPLWREDNISKGNKMPSEL